jgi:D-lactate dehydrogenase
MKKNINYKIAFISCEPWEIEYLQKKLIGLKPDFYDTIVTPADFKKLESYDIVSGFIYTNFTAKTLTQLPKLKYITTRSTGFDHIDIKVANKLNIKVSNVPLYGANTVAEHTFALILSLSRKMYDSINQTKRSDFQLDGLRGFDLQGKTIGVVGTGSIGAHVIRIAHGFGMNILLFDGRKNIQLAKKYHAKYVSFQTLLKHSDIISLHVAYNKKTYHLINQKNIQLIKQGAYLINTARGGLIETKALLKALVDKRLAGAGLDVLEEEGLIKEEVQLLDRQESREKLSTLLHDHILLKFDNVIVTPHNAFNSVEALQRILDTTIENILAFNVHKPINVVK